MVGKKKKLKLPIIFGLFILIAALVYYFTSSNKSTFNTKNINFSFDTFENIDGIKIANGNSAVEMNLAASGWKLASGENVDKSKVSNLFGAVKNLQMQSPVPKDEIDAFGDSIKVFGTHLVFLENGKEVYKLRFAKVENRIIAQNRNGNPYYVNIKGYSHVMLSDLTACESGAWMTKILFSYSKDEIKEISVYEPSKQKGFRLVNHSGKVELYNLKQEKATNISQERASDYLHFFKGVRFKDWDGAYGLNTHIFSLYVSTVSGKIAIDAFGVTNPATNRNDFNKFAAVVNRADTLLLNYEDFDPIVVDVEFFSE